MPGPAGIKEVAARAGVSVGTVSNVLNRPHVVREKTRRRVELAMADLGFVRNESARQLRAGRSRIVAFVLIDTANPYFTDVACGAEERSRDAGLALVLCSSGADAAREADHLSLLLEQRVRGVLVSSVDVNGERLRSLPRLGVPVVLVDRGAGPTGDWCSVCVDDVVGGSLAVAHLISLGHERIAFVGERAMVHEMTDRLVGARRAAEVAGLPADGLVVRETPGNTFAAGRETARWLAGTPPQVRPTGVFCANDLLALGVVQELVRKGLSIPRDVAVVGYDDIDLAEVAAVPLTSIRQPRYLIGRTAIDLLLRDCARDPGHVHEHVRFTPELVVRDSTASARGRT